MTTLQLAYEHPWATAILLIIIGSVIVEIIQAIRD